MREQTTHSKVIVRLGVGALLISFSGVWVKLAAVSPASSAFYRVAVGAIFLFAFSVARKESWVTEGKYLGLGWICALFFVFDLLCWHSAIQLVGPGLATLLANFQVFVLAAIGIWFLHERYTIRLLVGIPLAMVGLYCIIGPQWQTLAIGYRNGIYLGLAAALFYSGYLLTLRRLSVRCQATFYPLMLVSVLCSLLLGLYILFTGDTFIVGNLKSGLSLLGLGFFSQFLGWMLIAGSLPHLNIGYAGLLLLLQPSCAFVWDVLFFSRPTTFANWLGVSLALAGIYLGMTAKLGGK